MRPPHKGLLILAGLAVCFGVVAAEENARTGPEAPSPGVSTNNYYLERYLEQLTEKYEGEDGRWIFELYDVEMLLLGDEPSDRMRLLAEITDASEIEEEELRVLLEANFDRALDAKYAIWNGKLWASYVHPLSHLDPEEFRDAVKQVASLHHNYGLTYSSSGMLYRVDFADE